MKNVLLSIAVLGVVYGVFIDEKNSIVNTEQPETPYQREVEKAQEIESLLQETVDQRFVVMGLDKERQTK